MNITFVFWLFVLFVWPGSSHCQHLPTSHRQGKGRSPGFKIPCSLYSHSTHHNPLQLSSFWYYQLPTSCSWVHLKCCIQESLYCFHARLCLSVGFFGTGLGALPNTSGPWWSTWMTFLPLSPSRLLPLPLEIYLWSITPPSQDSSPKLTFLTRTECPPKFPQASCHQSLTPNPYRGLWPIDRTMTLTSGACLCWHSHKQPKCFFSSLCDLPHLSLWRPPKGSTEEWLCYFKPHRMEKQIYEVCPRMRLNVEMTLTSRNRIFTPKLGFSRQLSHWKSHKDSAGLMTAVICTVFSQHLETVAVNNFSLIFFL